MSSQTVQIPLSTLLATSNRRRRQRRTRRPRPKKNPVSSIKLQQLTESVQKLEGAVQKVLQPKTTPEQKFFLVKRPDERDPNFIIPPADKKDCRRKMGLESIQKLAKEISRSVTGGGGDIVYNDGAIHCHFEIMAPGHDSHDFDVMLASLNINNPGKGTSSTA